MVEQRKSSSYLWGLASFKWAISMLVWQWTKAEEALCLTTWVGGGYFLVIGYLGCTTRWGCISWLDWPRLCSSRARWPMAPNFCSRVTRKSLLFHRNHMVGTVDFTSSEHWAPFIFLRAQPCWPLDWNDCIYWIGLTGWTIMRLHIFSILKFVKFR